MVRSISCRRDHSPGGIFVHTKCGTSGIVLGLAIRQNSLAPDNRHAHIIFLKVIMWLSKIFVHLRSKLTSDFSRCQDYLSLKQNVAHLYLKPILQLGQGWNLNFWWAKLILSVCYRWKWSLTKKTWLKLLIWRILIFPALNIRIQQSFPKISRSLIICIKYHSGYIPK